MIALTPTSTAALLFVLIGYIFYTNRDEIRNFSTGKSKALFSLILLAEIGIIVGSRFVTPDIITLFISRNSGMFALLDVGVFLAILFASLKIANVIKAKLKLIG